jgi:hypothetical protein
LVQNASVTKISLDVAEVSQVMRKVLLSWEKVHFSPNGTLTCALLYVHILQFGVKKMITSKVKFDGVPSIFTFNYEAS